MGENELFYQLIKEIASCGQGSESYEVNAEDFIYEIAYRIYDGACTDYQMYIKKLTDDTISIYVESQETGETATENFKDIFEAETFLNMNGIEFEKVKLNRLNTYLIDEFQPKESITQSLHNIEMEIYQVDYDSLPDYLRGVRDMMNLITGNEDNTSIRKYIIEQLREISIPF